MSQVIQKHGRWQASFDEKPRQKMIGEIVQLIESQGNWTIWATMTFRNDSINPVFAMKSLREYIRSVAKHLKKHIRVAWFYGLQNHGTPHFHFLAMIDPKEKVQSILMPSDFPKWRHGSEYEIESYEPERHTGGSGACGYGAAHANWGIDVGCDRRHKCRDSGSSGCSDDSGHSWTSGSSLI